MDEGGQRGRDQDLKDLGPIDETSVEGAKVSCKWAINERERGRKGVREGARTCLGRRSGR